MLSYTIDPNDKTVVRFASDIGLKTAYCRYMTNPISPLKAVTLSPAPEQLSELPSLASLFRKAMVKSSTFQLGQSLPYLSNYVKGVQIDQNHLRAYQKLLGFDQDQTVSYTHLRAHET